MINEPILKILCGKYLNHNCTFLDFLKFVPDGLSFNGFIINPKDKVDNAFFHRFFLDLFHFDVFDLLVFLFVEDLANIGDLELSVWWEKNLFLSFVVGVVENSPS